MTEFEKMRSSQLYNFSDPEIWKSLKHAKEACVRLQTMTITDDDYREVIEDLIPGIPADSVVCPPFHCDHGNGIRLGRNVFVNYNCTMLDGGLITIGDDVKIGPHCQLYTPQHPLRPRAAPRNNRDGLSHNDRRRHMAWRWRGSAAGRYDRQAVHNRGGQRCH